METFIFNVNGSRVSKSELETIARTQIRLSDSRYDIELAILQLPKGLSHSSWTLSLLGVEIASFGTFKTALSQDVFMRLQEIADENVDDRNELFTHLHSSLPNNKRIRTTDPTHLLQRVCDQLSDELMVRKPPVEHNKMGFKKSDVEDLTQLHVDRFEGMRQGTYSTRRRIFRHFINIGANPRNVCFALMNPDFTDECVPDKYSENYLDSLIERLNYKIEVLVHSIPSPMGNVLFNCRYLATHLLHCEYGKAPDAVIVVNSDNDLGG